MASEAATLHLDVDQHLLEILPFPLVDAHQSPQAQVFNADDHGIPFYYNGTWNQAARGADGTDEI
jgi:hypothetical protein